MAYQNISSSPRFYIDYFTYWQSIGMIKEITKENAANSLEGNPIGLDPSSITTLTNNDKWSMKCQVVLNNPISMRVIHSVNYCGILGHNFGNINITPNASSSATPDDLFLAYRLNYKNTDWATTTPESGTNWRGSFTGHSNNYEDIINTEASIDGTGVSGNTVMSFIKLPNSGFSLCKPNISTNNFYDDIQFFEYIFLAYDNSTTNWCPTYSAELQTNSLVMGHSYDMPHSPELELTMKIEFDGYDNVQTLGGSDLTNIRYTGNPKWGNNNAWEIGDSNPYYKRKGRRSWTLKFNHISDKDIFASNYSSNTYLQNGADSSNDAYNDNDDLNSDRDAFEYTLADDDSFMAKVWDKTLGGALPFIFQPDSNNNNPDQFCIAKFDQDSLNIKQVAFKSYEIALKIREVW